MRKLTLLFLLVMLSSAAFAQRIQRVKGKVVDKESNSPLIGVTVGVIDLPTPLGSATDINGSFIIDKVPVGKHTIKISYIGYADVTLYDVLVTSAKETILNIELEEQAIK